MQLQLKEEDHTMESLWIKSRGASFGPSPDCTAALKTELSLGRNPLIHSAYAYLHQEANPTRLRKAESQPNTGQKKSCTRLVGLRTQTQNAAFLNAKDLNASPGPEGSL